MALQRSTTPSGDAVTSPNRKPLGSGIPTKKGPSRGGLGDLGEATTNSAKSSRAQRDRDSGVEAVNRLVNGAKSRKQARRGGVTKTSGTSRKLY